LLPLAAILAAPWYAPRATAVDYTWTGPGAGTGTTPTSGSFSVGDSWLGETVPTFDATADVLFNFTAGTGAAITATNDLGTISMNSLSALNTRTGTASITITGGTLNFMADAGVDPTLTMSDTSTQPLVINSALSLGANLTLRNFAGAANRMDIGTGATAGMGNIDLGAFTLTLTNDASNTTSAYQFGAGFGNTNRAVISGTGSVVMSNVANGTVAFFGASTFSGGFTLNSGVLVPGTSSIGSVGAVTSGALGTGTFTINGGTVRATSGGNITLLNEMIFGGNFTLGDATTTGTILNGNATMTANRTITVTGGGTAADLTNRHMLGGVISDGGSGFSLTKTGAGTLVVSGASTYSGATNVINGALVVAANVPCGRSQSAGECNKRCFPWWGGRRGGEWNFPLVGVPGASPGAATITVARDITVGNVNSTGTTTLGTTTDTDAIFSGASA
jgi:autotransporter-associated beta strand protein